jgi:hypothetical protein
MNLAMDISRVVPKGVHFARWFTHDGVHSEFKWHDRWSVRPNKYYFIDFGLSSKYPMDETDIMDDGILGQDLTVPELSLNIPYNPFKVDIYQLGNALLKVIDVSPLACMR